MKKLISCLMVLTLLISMASVFAITGTAAQSSDIDIWDGSVSTSLSGSGTSADPYLIQSGADLAYLAQIVNADASSTVWNEVSTYGKYFKLTKSIDLNNLEWTPIGKDASALSGPHFSGYFDGNGYCIYNLLVGSNGKAYPAAGLFGAAYSGSISNLGIESGIVYVNQAGYSGAGIVAKTRVSTKISNCYNKATIVKNYDGSYSALGGIVGLNEQHAITIENCVNYGLIDGDGNNYTSYSWNSQGNGHGGILGKTVTAANVSNCYNLGDVVSASNNVGNGGIIGVEQSGATVVTNCYSSGVVCNVMNAGSAGYLIGASKAGTTCTDSVAYTKGHSGFVVPDNKIAMSVSYGISGTVNSISTATINTTDTLVVPTESIFEDFLVATTYGATLGAVEKYDDITEYRGETYTAPVKDGFVFAGWFIDARCTTALGADVKDGAAYAKFVDADALTVNFQVTAGTTAESETTNLRLLTTVESTNLACVGFIITYGEKTLDAKLSTTVYKSVKGSTEADTFTYGPQYFSGVSEYFATYSITDVPTVAFDQTFTVVPTWTTLDGTVVEGSAANVKISASFAG